MNVPDFGRGCVSAEIPSMCGIMLKDCIRCSASVPAVEIGFERQAAFFNGTSTLRNKSWLASSQHRDRECCVGNSDLEKYPDPAMDTGVLLLMVCGVKVLASGLKSGSYFLQKSSATAAPSSFCAASFKEGLKTSGVNMGQGWFLSPGLAGKLSGSQPCHGPAHHCK